MFSSLQHFQFCRPVRSLGIPYFSIFYRHINMCLCRVDAVKSHPVHSVRDVLFPILKDRLGQH
jgi:hypothetical protein